MHTEPTVLLVDLPPAFSAAIENEARRAGLATVRSDGELTGVPAAGLRMAVLGARASDAAAFRRVRSAARLVSGRPLVVLGERLRARDGLALARLGATDVVDLPASPDRVASELVGRLGTANGETPEDERFVGESAPMLALRADAQRVASSSTTVLIVGETGTGKGVLARRLHATGALADQPLVHVDCAALSPTIIESELFGHERGAFTGAAQRRPGRFELADGGTIFLDEIGDLHPELQTKLLRVLEDRAFERVGGTRTLEMNARVIAATSRDLGGSVDAGRFRPDLYFRLAVCEFRIPPLRERPEDLPGLVVNGLRRIASRLGVVCPLASRGFLVRLRDHAWPGNVRELMNLLERVLLRHRDAAMLRGEWLDELLVVRPRAALRAEAVALEGADPEDRETIARVLIEAGGNVTRAARRLKIPRGTLRYRIDRHALRHLIPSD